MARVHIVSVKCQLSTHQTRAHGSSQGHCERSKQSSGSSGSNATKTMEAAILREKRIKRWPRAWKYDLIHKENPTWRDIAEDFGFAPLSLMKAGPGSRPG